MIPQFEAIMLNLFQPIVCYMEEIGKWWEPSLCGCIYSLEARGLINDFRDYVLNKVC